jgi:hypothetical protein
MILFYNKYVLVGTLIFKMKKNILKQFITVSIFLVSVSFISSANVYAANNDCATVLKAFESSAVINPGITMLSTTSGFATSLSLTALHLTIGANAESIVGCEKYVLGNKGVGPTATGGRLGFAGTDVCDTGDTAVCDELVNSAKIVYRYENKPTKLLAIDGSLWGLAGRLESVNRQDPVALNLAYYWNDQIAHIPFINKALAAGSVSNYANMPILNSTLDLWRIVRDISLGLISIVLLYTGIMIVMRKKVNPQLVVSVQYAIPKILVGLVLIIFSFPIGAAITSISWALFRGAGALVASLTSGTPLASQSLSGWAMLAIVIAILKNGAAGAFFIVLAVVAAIVMLLLKLAVELKAILIYIKMVLSTVTAPFEFALGTVPGNDDKIKDWFTRMAKYGLSVFAMGLVIPATLTVALHMLLDYSGIDPTTGLQSTNIETAGMGTLMFMIAPLVVVVFGFSLALSMESSIDKMFFGGDSKKKR